MYKDKVVITVVIAIVFSAIIFGSLMAYQTYKSPMSVNNIDDAISTIRGSSENDNNHILERFAMLKKLSISCKMRDAKTGEIRKFSRKEMDEFNERIGGKEAVLNYLRNIENEEERRNILRYAREQLKIISDDEFIELWNYKTTLFSFEFLLITVNYFKI